MLSIIKKKFRENANIINVFSIKRKMSGVVYGGNSRKLEITYKFLTNYSQFILQKMKTK